MFKKIYVILLVAVLTAGFAQAQFKFGARAGLNLTTFGGGDSEGMVLGTELSPKMKPGFQIGVVGEYAFNEEFAIQPGIVFTTQGAKYNGSETYSGINITYDASFNLNYIRVPVNFLYKLDLGGAKLLFQAGPYFGLGIGGKVKSDASGGGVEYSSDFKVKFGKEGDDDDIMYFDKTLEVGLGLGVGVQFLENFQVGLGYNLGFTSMFKDETLKNNGFALTFTYLFGQ